MAATRTVRSVSEITDLLKSLIEQQPHLQNVWVQGQVSNYNKSAAGHIYFTLKDEKSQIRCALFRSSAVRVRFSLRDG